MKKDYYYTNVIDAGVRFGMHPSFESFTGEFKYFGFDPDKQEIERLKQYRNDPRCEYISLGLSNEKSEKTLKIYAHKGYNSFLEPNKNSLWFGSLRKSETDLIRSEQVKTTTIDAFANERNISIDFIKADTEGTELSILHGALEQIKTNVLGCRIEVSFAELFHKQESFADIHSFLLNNNFFLLNLDYLGRGTPRNSLFRSPDPQGFSFERYGTLETTDGVWLRKLDHYLKNGKFTPEEADSKVLKYASFCICNNAPDVAYDELVKYLDSSKGWQEETVHSPIFKSLKKKSAQFLGRWRVVPDSQWDYCREIFKKVFADELPSGSGFWEYVQKL